MRVEHELPNFVLNRGCLVFFLQVDLKFVLGEEKTLVTSNIRVLPNSSGSDH